MKIRSFLLVSSLVVVPLFAMFSHRVPPGVRAAVGRFVGGLAGGERPGPGPAPIDATVPPAPVPQAAGVPMDTAPAATAPPVVPVAAHVPDSDGMSRLRALGAIAIDCRPLDGNGGHVASCRVPVDSSGQLQRVFQATGPNAVSATERLFHDVTAWLRGKNGLRRETMRF